MSTTRIETSLAPAADDETYAICVPVGDQIGPDAPAGLTIRGSVPSALATTSDVATPAMRLPSGENRTSPPKLLMGSSWARPRGADPSTGNCHTPIGGDPWLRRTYTDRPSWAQKPACSRARTLPVGKDRDSCKAPPTPKMLIWVVPIHPDPPVQASSRVG